MRQALLLLLARFSYHNHLSVAGSTLQAFVPLTPSSLPSTRQRRDCSRASFATTTPPPPPTTTTTTTTTTTRTFVTKLLAKPKKAGATVDSYQTVSVNCNKCQQRLFRYKKKNGTKSNLIKCYIERICEDSAGVLALAASEQQTVTTTTTEPGSKAEIQGPFNNKKNNKKNRNKKSKHKVVPSSVDNNNNNNNNNNHDESSNVEVLTQLDPSYSWECPNCHTQFARSSLIHGRPALKLVGGKIRMTKK